VVSERIRRFGSERPVPGDLVLEKSSQTDQEDVDVDELEEQQDNEVISNRNSGNSHLTQRTC
jgi:hypothetical protein